jgi:hypothetical protein
MRTFKFLVPFQGYIPRVHNPYDIYVEREIRDHLNMGVNWRGFETLCEVEYGELVKLKIVSGINQGGLLQVLYLVTKFLNIDNEETTAHSLTIALNIHEDYLTHLR